MALAVAVTILAIITWSRPYLSEPIPPEAIYPPQNLNLHWMLDAEEQP